MAFFWPLKPEFQLIDRHSLTGPPLPHQAWLKATGRSARPIYRAGTSIKINKNKPLRYQQYPARSTESGRSSFLDAASSSSSPLLLHSVHYMVSGAVRPTTWSPLRNTVFRPRQKQSLAADSSASSPITLCLL